MEIKNIIKTYSNGLTTVNEEEKTIVGIISSADIDRDNDIIYPDKIDDTNYQKNPVVLFGHNINHVVGKSLWRKVDGKNYISKTKFANTTLANELWSLYKDGFMRSASVGFIPNMDEIKQKDGIRYFGRVELLEYSCVSVPANPSAVTVDFIKGLTSEELKVNLLEQYMTEVMQKEMTSLRSLISEQSIQLKMINDKFTEFQDLYGSMLSKQRIKYIIENIKTKM